jgi:hypothetical protein
MKKANHSFLVSAVQKALFDFRMVQAGDRLLVGVSGGKDSMALLHALDRLSSYHPVQFRLAAATVRMGFERGTTDGMLRFARRGIPFQNWSGLGVELLPARTMRMDPEAMSLLAVCARTAGCFGRTRSRRMRPDALGHNRDDVLETFLMKLGREGRIGSFAPVTALDRSGVVQIRPLIYVPSTQVAAYCKKHEIPVATSECPFTGRTARAGATRQLDALEREIPDLRAQMFGAIRKDVWPSPQMFFQQGFEIVEGAGSDH